MEPPRTPQCEKKASLAAYLGLDGGAAEKRRWRVKRKVRRQRACQAAQSARAALEEANRAGVEEANRACGWQEIRREIKCAEQRLKEALAERDRLRKAGRGHLPPNRLGILKSAMTNGVEMRLVREGSACGLFFCSTCEG